MKLEQIHDRIVETQSLAYYSTAVVAGVGDDFIFEQSLIEYNLVVIGINPNPLYIDSYNALLRTDKSLKNQFTIIPYPLTPANESDKHLYLHNGKPFTTMSCNAMVDQNSFVITPTCSVNTIKNHFGRLSLFVIDLHGEEYKIAKSIDLQCQMIIRFYQAEMKYPPEHTQKLIDGIKKRGYAGIHITSNQNYIEVTFMPLRWLS